MLGAILGGVGGVAGAFAGYNYRRWLSRGAKFPDLLIALVEDLVAVGGALLLVSPSIKIQTHLTVAGILSLPGGRHGRV